MDKEKRNGYAVVSRVLYILLVALTVYVDRLSKELVVKYLKPISDFPLWKGVFHLTYVENRGAAFGMLSDKRIVFMVCSTVLIIAVGVYLLIKGEKLHPLFALSLTLIVGGGIGNMIDRIAYGYVVDFLNFELINFAVFNVADSFICIGAGLIVIYTFVSEAKDSKVKKAQTAQESKDVAYKT